LIGIGWELDGKSSPHAFKKKETSLGGHVGATQLAFLTCFIVVA